MTLYNRVLKFLKWIKVIKNERLRILHPLGLIWFVLRVAIGFFKYIYEFWKELKLTIKDEVCLW